MPDFKAENGSPHTDMPSFPVETVFHQTFLKTGLEGIYTAKDSKALA